MTTPRLTAADTPPNTEPSAPTCAQQSQERAEPLAATAPHAPAWLLIEHPGPWGPDPCTGDRLTSTLAALRHHTHGTGLRLALIRRPDRHRTPCPAPAVYLAHTHPDHNRLYCLPLTNLAHLLTIDPNDLATTDCGLGTPQTSPLFLVCTHGRHDRCCAIHGRPLTQALARTHPDDTWETTHLGGHRFAPTLLILPDGYLYGRLSAQAATATAQAASQGDVPLEGCRGRTTWQRPGQAADLAIRALTGYRPADALTVEAITATRTDHWTVTVRNQNGHAWRVDVTQHHDDEPRPTSCTGTPQTTTRMSAQSVQPILDHVG
ncbi:sucrase ferredoxin [Streptomyces wedmorensis]